MALPRFQVLRMADPSIEVTLIEPNKSTFTLLSEQQNAQRPQRQLHQILAMTDWQNTASKVVHDARLPALMPLPR